jgi:hypothetical protein
LRALRLARSGASVEPIRRIPVERRFGGTPLDWALHRYSELKDPAARLPFFGIVRALLDAGATLNSDDPHLDLEMRAALGTSMQ